MKHHLFWILTALFLFISVLFLLPKAHCGWCPQYRCYGSNCTSGCVCITPQGEAGGFCATIERKVPK